MISLICGIIIGLLILPLIRLYRHSRYLKQSDYLNMDTRERRQMAARDEM